MKRQNSQRGASHGAAESCIALIDARFLAWLQGNTDGSQEAVRPHLLALLGSATANHGLDVNLRRIYWYTDTPDDQAVDAQDPRCVATWTRWWFVHVARDGRRHEAPC